jgi:L-cysteine desulfidase
MALAETGLHGRYGISLGKNLSMILKNKKGKLNLIDKVRITAACAGDARMGGAPYPVMGSAGVGNQGITALIPVAVIGHECKYSKEDICRAALISHLFTRNADNYLGHRSELCGCSIKAGIGATAGVTYLIGGGENEINMAINLVTATIAGTICDGAKASCTLKISHAAGIATECAFLAVKGMKIPTNIGIIQRNALNTLQVLETISRAMTTGDTEIIKILKKKSAS